MDRPITRRRLSSIKLTRQYHFRYLGLWVLMTLTLVLIVNVVLYALMMDRWRDVGGLGEGPNTDVEFVRNVFVASMVAWTLFFLAAIGGFAMVTVHRIAGPFIRLRMAFEEVRDGNFEYRLRFRSYDHLQDIEQSFNEMMESIGREIGA